MNNTTYTKLRDGTWGIRRTGPAAPGLAVLVVKRDGSTKSELLGAVVWTSPDNSVSIYQIGTGAMAAPTRATGGAHRTGCSCGSREDRYGQLIRSSRNCASCEHDA